jgi:NAD(P)-dependent dehydrogenase (short-subunit alcohol dehydrogenase family)
VTRQAIVTGGGSGIGRALVHALTRDGVHVACADIDGAAASRTADAAPGPGTATATTVDVTDAAAVQGMVDDVVRRAGRLDLMFNNAGITFGGETEELTLAQWDAIIDVNVRGVVHGVAAAYPVMIRQGHGQIVNTASMGGLMAAGLITSYVMTKHAVVGLSLALRSEAAAKGVGVTVVCPSAVDTPNVLARQVLAAVARNRAMLVTPRTARLAWRFGRLSPRLAELGAARFVTQQRRLQSR